MDAWTDEAHFQQERSRTLFTQLDPIEAYVERPHGPVLDLWADEPPDYADDGERGVTPEFTTTEEQDAVSIGFIHSGWQAARTKIAQAFKAGSASISATIAFLSCGTRAWVCASDEEVPQFKVAANWCRSRWCLVCQRRRAIHLAGRISELVVPKRTRLVTLTLRGNDEPLRSQVLRIFKAFRRLRQRKLWKETQEGGIAFLELTRGKDGDHWHVHLHILSVGRFIPKEALSAAWLQITGDSMITDIRFVRDARQAVKYVTKYTAKSYDGRVNRDSALLAEMIDHLHGVRSYCVFGSWRTALVQQEPSDIIWKPIGPLADFVIAAATGDESAQKIIDRLAMHHDASRSEERAPPGWKATASPTLLDSLS